MEKLIYKDKEINYTIIKKKKKYISISVKRDGNIVVSIPNQVTKKYAKNFVQLKADWIYERYMNIISNKIEKQFIQNENFLFLGKNYKLNFISTDLKRINFEIKGDSLNLFINENLLSQNELIKTALIKWYKVRSKEILMERYKILADKTGLEAVEVRVRELKRSHGICYSHGKITLNWKLVMCNTNIIDYVILHELCHLKHLNHSKSFWATVESFMPDYMFHSEELKNLSKKYAFEI